MIELGDAYTFEPACALYAETQNGKQVNAASPRRRVTGEVVYINERHGFFRVRYRLPGFAGDGYECFRMPRPAPTAPFRYGNPLRIGSVRRTGDSRYSA